MELFEIVIMGTLVLYGIVLSRLVRDKRRARPSSHRKHNS